MAGKVIKRNATVFDSNTSLFNLWTGLFVKELRYLAIPGIDLSDTQKEEILNNVREEYMTSLQDYLSSNKLTKEFEYVAKWWFKNFKPSYQDVADSALRSQDSYEGKVDSSLSKPYLAEELKKILQKTQKS